MAEKIVELAGLTPDTDLRKLLLRLAGEAEAGDLAGAIVISVYGRGRAKKRYYISLAGWPAQNTTYAAGAMSSCQFLIQERALQDAGLI